MLKTIYIRILYTSLLNMLLITGMYAKKNTLQDEFNKKVKNGISAWMQEQISKDLNDAKDAGYSFDVNPELNNWFNGNLFAIRYKINNNKITIQYPINKAPESIKTERINRMSNIFIALSKLIEIPDVDIIVYINDHVDGWGSHVPGILFGAAKNKHMDKNIILMPDFHTLDIYPDLVKQVEVGNSEYPWEVKKNQAFWIGATTGGHFTINNYKEYPRIKIVDLSFKFPDLLYARLSALVQMDSDVMPLLGNYLAQYIQIKDHMYYKYQVAIEGNGTAYPRTYWQLFANSALLKQQSDSVQWYHNALKEYEHYIPFKHDVSNFIEQLVWAQANDDKAKQIALNANNFAFNNLQLADNLYYLYILLKEVSKLQN